MVSLSQQQQQQQQKTLGFLKPDVMNRKTELMQQVKSKTLWTVTFEEELCLSLEEARRLYPQSDIASWLSSGPIYVFILKGPNVVKNWYKYAGPKDSAKAKQVSPQSLRGMYGLDDIQNVCHASSSDKEAQRDLTWLKNLMANPRLSIPLDTGSAPSPKQRRLAASTKPTSTTNVAASKNSMTAHPAAVTTTTTTTKHLSTTSDSSSSSSSSSFSSLPTKQFMPHSRVNSSPTTPSLASKVNGNLQIQQSGTTKPPLAKPAKTIGNSSKKRLSNATQGAVKITPVRPTSVKQQHRKLSKVETEKTTTLIDSNNSHIQPQHPIETIPYNPPQNGSDNIIDSSIVDSPVTIPSINGILDNVLDDNDNEGHQSPNHHNPYAAMASFSTNSLASTSTISTVDSDHHHHDKEVFSTTTISRSATMDHHHISNNNNDIRIISPNHPIDNVHRRTTISDVDSLRHEFEALCQPKIITRTPPSVAKATRINELKPKNPSGSRVKSMVAYFMDENLHKWEF